MNKASEKNKIIVSGMNSNTTVKLQILKRDKNKTAAEIVSNNHVLINVQKKKSDFPPGKESHKDLLEAIENIEMSTRYTNENKRESRKQFRLTRCIAMDCEMVGIGDGKESMIARVSIVNDCGVCIYDKYVKPMVTVKNYRTPVSGIEPHHLKNGEDFEIVHKEVADILRGRILVGHALHNDLYVLFLSHPKHLQRDTAKYFRKLTKGSTPSLKSLATEFLGLDIQNGVHNSIEDAWTAMQLYKLFKTRWENDLKK